MSEVELEGLQMPPVPEVESVAVKPLVTSLESAAVLAMLLQELSVGASASSGTHLAQWDCYVCYHGYASSGQHVCGGSFDLMEVGQQPMQQ